MRENAVNEVRTTLRDDLIAAKALIDTPGQPPRMLATMW